MSCWFCVICSWTVRSGCVGLKFPSLPRMTNCMTPLTLCKGGSTISLFANFCWKFYLIFLPLTLLYYSTSYFYWFPLISIVFSCFVPQISWLQRQRQRLQRGPQELGRVLEALDEVTWTDERLDQILREARAMGWRHDWVDDYLWIAIILMDTYSVLIVYYMTY